jgi:hypothetical protein
MIAFTFTNTAVIGSAAKKDLILAKLDATDHSTGTVIAALVGAGSNNVCKSGVYCTIGGLTVGADATFTLNAKHNPNAICIFNIGAAATMGASVQVVIINLVATTSKVW